MDVPTTVTAALEDLPVEGAVCLEAGAGVGNATAGLLEAGADRVYAVTDDPGDARTVRERVGDRAAGRVTVVEADLRAIPLGDGAVEFVTAHGLFNVVPPASLGTVAAELTRVATPGAHLVVDDYAPLPEDAAVRDLFAVENAAAELATGRPALSFYPSSLLRHLFAGHGWTLDRERTLLDPVPWTGSHAAAHADAARAAARTLPGRLREPLLAEIERVESDVAGESAGEMYSLAMGLPGETD